MQLPFFVYLTHSKASSYQLFLLFFGRVRFQQGPKSLPINLELNNLFNHVGMVNEADNAYSSLRLGTNKGLFHKLFE